MIFESGEYLDWQDLLSFELEDEDYISHIGTPHEGSIPHSGRFPYGSGEHAFQRGADFYNSYKRLENQGLTQREIAERLGVVNRFGKPDVVRLRTKMANAKAERRAELTNMAMRLKDEGHNTSEIGRIMGINESSVRSLLDPAKAARNDLNSKTAEILKDYVDKNRYVDISTGINHYLGVTDNRVKNAVALLEEEGYKKQMIQIDQLGTDHKTTITVLTPPDCDYNELSEHRYDIRFPLQDGKKVDETGDLMSLGVSEPVSIDSKRILIKYNEEGGIDKDGNIELRRGVDDISLNGNDYAQVRIAVDGTHYLKGMATYSDDIPQGYDIVFNTNKHLGTDPNKVFKSMETDKDGNIDKLNPFGSSYTTMDYVGSDGKVHQSAINVVRKEGEWATWDKNLASQFLSKQPLNLAQRQLGLSVKDKTQELDDILALTNPAVKQTLLLKYADKCDSLAVDLKAAPFARQQTHVILPFPDLKDNECYAPNYADGTRVALVRYPHGGTFEIPELTVRNIGSPAAKVIPNAPDAIGINARVAERLSGADFDGDTVVVIPLSEKVRVRSTPALEGLKGFDPKERYPYYEGMKVISEQTKQNEMGRVSNLITDMTIKGANANEIAAAVRHSMVVIDAEKHKLNYKQSEKDNHIADLKKKYQDDGEGHTGASTIISRASSEVDVPTRKDWYPSSTSIGPNGEKILTARTNDAYAKGTLKGIPLKDGTLVMPRTEKKTGNIYYTKDDPATGKKVRVYVNKEDFDGDIDTLKKERTVTVLTDKNDGRLYYLKTDSASGKKVRVYASEDDFTKLETKNRTQKSTRMAEEADAYRLTSGGSKELTKYPMENLYAEYANSMKGLANKARLEYTKTGNLERNPKAAKEYQDEVKSLNQKVKNIEAHAPIERQAQLLGNRLVAMKKEANPGMDKDELSKLKGRAITSARQHLTDGQGKPRLEITDREWEAIQSGAISHSKLRTILDYADIDDLKKRATPKATKTITPAMESLAKSMEASGYTTAQIADRLGISSSSVYNIVKA